MRMASTVIGLLVISTLAVVSVFSSISATETLADYGSESRCDEAVVKWHQITVAPSAVNDPNQKVFFATELAKLSLVCGSNKYKPGKDYFVPESIVTLSTTDQIMEEAKRQIERDTN